MNKKGFTLVELMAVIAIIIFIGIIVVPGVLDIIKDNRNKGYSEIERRLEEAAAKYMANEYIDSKQDSIIITKKQLIETGYIKEIYDLKDNSVCDASIYAYNLNSVAEFNPILTCSNYETKGKNAAWYIKELYKNEEELNNGLINPKVTYEGKEYDTGIRYSGSLEEVKNKVYYNCEDIDSNNVKYGEDGYDYANSCEIWRIIGVFDVDDGSGKIEKRLKLTNISSTFTASWDSSASDMNGGWGINQWGVSGDYLGADLMQLLNGYYIGAENSICTYCNGSSQSACEQTCTAESLTNKNMKPLTSKAKGMIENAMWDTYGIHSDLYPATSSNVNITYLQEKGISTQYTGKICTQGIMYCDDKITRTTSWTGLVGLMSVRDITYADGWLYKASIYPWTITPVAFSTNANFVWYANDNHVSSRSSTSDQHAVYPTVYLKSNIKIKSGNGSSTTPYILGM